MSPIKIGVSSMSALSWIANLNNHNAAGQLILAASPRCDQGGGRVGICFSERMGWPVK
jgi:hypothetical protein